jgi:hypothetical protein
MGSDETPVFQPYIHAGAGYGWSSFIGKNQGVTGTQTITETLSGFMYQAVLGFSLNLGMMSEGSASSTSLILEAGYRGGLLSTKGGTNVDYGGIVVRGGVSFAM